MRLEPTESDRGRPDGAAVDPEGCYWTALFEGGRIQRYSPDGRLLAEYAVPARCPTMVGFGGPDLKTLYVTSARTGRSESELAGISPFGQPFLDARRCAWSARNPFRSIRLRPNMRCPIYKSFNTGLSRTDPSSITGGASGIGEEMVKAFVAQGARVSFIDIADMGEALASANRRELSCLRRDRHSSACAQVLARDRERPGRGRGSRQQCRQGRSARDAEVEPDYWRRALALNLDHQFFATQAVSSGMAKAGRGSVIMLGSISWMRGRPGMVGYTTAKAAINGMTRTLARELGPSGIRVNCIVPGAILTERQKTALADAGAEPAVSRPPGAEIPARCQPCRQDGALPRIGRKRRLHRRELHRRCRPDPELRVPCTIQTTSNGFDLVLDGKALLRHRSDAPCLFVGQGEARMDMYRGNFDIEDYVVERTPLAHAVVSESGDRLFRRSRAAGPAGARVSGATATVAIVFKIRAIRPSTGSGSALS